MFIIPVISQAFTHFQFLQTIAVIPEVDLEKLRLMTEIIVCLLNQHCKFRSFMSRILNRNLIPTVIVYQERIYIASVLQQFIFKYIHYSTFYDYEVKCVLLFNGQC